MLARVPGGALNERLTLVRCEAQNARARCVRVCVRASQCAVPNAICGRVRAESVCTAGSGLRGAAAFVAGRIFFSGPHAYEAFVRVLFASRKSRVVVVVPANSDAPRRHWVA